MSATIKIAHPAPDLIEVDDLHVSFGKEAESVVKGVSFRIKRGECVALVGESGSGKSVTSRALAGLAGPGAEIRAAGLRFAGDDVRDFSPGAWRNIRGKRIGFVMQDALGSLDPLKRVGEEIDEALRLHTPLTRAQRADKVVELLHSVGVPEPELRAKQYPHQLSGGLRQRALIASAIACGPELLIADEPTTALDALVQAQILDLLESLRTPDTGMLIVSHDFSVVSRLADRVLVMQHGRVVEEGTARSVLRSPRHHYTRALIDAVTTVHAPPKGRIRTATRLNGPPLIEVQGLHKSFVGPDAKRRQAVSDISFRLEPGETVGIVGGSGSGKTTAMRIVLGLEQPDSGSVLIHGKDWSTLSARARNIERKRIQIVFQDPLRSFDPRYTVERVIGEALDAAGYARGAARQVRALELLQLVRLDGELLERRPIEMSGGQRQRVAIARALAAEPDILICDEPVSALDVIVQAQILELLADLKRRLGLSCLFISHDLSVIRTVSDRVLVMLNGEVVESGPVDEIFDNPRHVYTRELFDAIPHFTATETRRAIRA
jgi:peptide/nickel transport system ATP-binding protein